MVPRLQIQSSCKAAVVEINAWQAVEGSAVLHYWRNGRLLEH